MKQEVKEFIFDIFRQIVGWSKRREGVIIPTPYTLRKMSEYGVSIATLEDVFRYGQRKNYKIVRRYANSTVGLYFKTVNNKRYKSNQRYVITTCWKNKRKF